jgi:GntR family transcriptional regulator
MASLQGTALDPNNRIPLYHQLHDILRAKIISGEWQADQLLPAEPVLMQHYGVSRITVRQAINLLVHENLVHRQSGRGTFVMRPSLETDATRIVSFQDAMRRAGFEPTSQVHEKWVFPASGPTAAALAIAPDDELACLRLLQLANGEPVGVEESFLVHRLCPGILDRFDFTKTAVLDALSESYGIRLVRATQTISALEAPPEFADLLRARRKSILLYLERISFSQQNVPIEFRRCYYRADRYVLQHEMRA